MSFNYKLLINKEINIGEKETKIRLISGSILLFVSLFTAKIILLLAGLALIATGYTRICPAYSAMERNTCKTPDTAAE